MRKVLVGFGLATIAALALGACGGGDDNKAAEEPANKLTGGSALVEEMVRQGRLGRKSGQGFYQYAKPAPDKR